MEGERYMRCNVCVVHAGGFCPGGTNGEVTPLKSELNFWRSSNNSTQLFRRTALSPCNFASKMPHVI